MRRGPERHMRDGGAHCPWTVREFTNSAGANKPPRGSKMPHPPALPRQWPEMRPHHAARWRPATAAPAWGSLFRRHKVLQYVVVRPNCAVPGPRNGLHCMCSKAHPDKAPRGSNTTYSRLLEGRCVGCRRVGQIGEASKTRAVPRCPGVRWRWMCTGKGLLLWRGVRNRSTRSVGLYVLGSMFVLREHGCLRYAVHGVAHGGWCGVG